MECGVDLGDPCGVHLLWVDPARDPARDLVISSRWGAKVELLLAAVSAAVEPNRR